jgi:oxygen-independent coproporphyrinogen-3 oxidase
MEVPYNTGIFKEMKILGQNTAPVADWKTKRRWVADAFAAFERAGYTVASAYTAVRDSSRTKFLYRDLLWAGADLIGAGVASFSHIGGTHFQNQHDWEPYLAAIHRGELPIYRALTPSAEERMIREFVLQMKLGHLDSAYFQNKFGVDVQRRFHEPLQKLQDRGFLQIDRNTLRLNRDGLLQVDRLLYEFFLPEHRTTSHA